MIILTVLVTCYWELREIIGIYQNLLYFVIKTSYKRCKNGENVVSIQGFYTYFVATSDSGYEKLIKSCLITLPSRLISVTYCTKYEDFSLSNRKWSLCNTYISGCCLTHLHLVEESERYINCTISGCKVTHLKANKMVHPKVLLKRLIKANQS